MTNLTCADGNSHNYGGTSLQFGQLLLDFLGIGMLQRKPSQSKKDTKVSTDSVLVDLLKKDGHDITEATEEHQFTEGGDKPFKVLLADANPHRSRKFNIVGRGNYMLLRRTCLLEIQREVKKQSFDLLITNTVVGGWDDTDKTGDALLEMFYEGAFRGILILSPMALDARKLVTYLQQGGCPAAWLLATSGKTQSHKIEFD